MGHKETQKPREGNTLNYRGRFEKLVELWHILFDQSGQSSLIDTSPLRGSEYMCLGACFGKELRLTKNTLLLGLGKRTGKIQYSMIGNTHSEDHGLRKLEGSSSKPHIFSGVVCQRYPTNHSKKIDQCLFSICRSSASIPPCFFVSVW